MLMLQVVRTGIKNFGSGQLIFFKNWSGGPVDVFLEPQPKFPNLMNVNIQTWMLMQWQP